MIVCSQMSLSAIVLKSPLRITHLIFEKIYLEVGYIGVLGGLGMPAEWSLGIVVSIFILKCVIRDCSCYGAVKFLEHGVKAVELFFLLLYILME